MIRTINANENNQPFPLKIFLLFLFSEFVILALTLYNYHFSILFLSPMVVSLAFWFFWKFENYYLPIIIFSILAGNLSTIQFARKIPNLFFVDIVILIVFFIILLKYLQKENIFSFSIYSFELLFIIFIIYSFMSTIQSLDFFRGIGELRGIVASLFVFMVALRSIKHKDAIRRLFWVFMFWGAMLSLIQINHVLKQGNILMTVVTKNVHLSWGSSNYIASFYALLIPIGISTLFSKEISIPSKICLILIIILMISALFLTGSRGGVLALFIGMLFLFLRFKTWKARAYFLFLLIIIGLVIYLNPSSKIVWESITGFKTSSSVFSRIGTWIESFKVFQAHPLLGVGPGNMHYYIKSYYIRATGGFTLLKAHNLALELLAETGIVGFLIFIAIISKILKVQIQNCSRITDKFHLPLAWGILVGTISALIHSMVEPNILSYMYGIIFWTIAAMAIKQQQFFRTKEPVIDDSVN
ncbi:MAG: O-antigen ligase family protein [Promethearchaeota archaeon]